MSSDLLQALLEYLQARPFNEVSGLISALVGQIRAQEEAAQAKQPKAPTPAIDNAVKAAMEEVKKNAAPATDDLAKKRKVKQ